MGRIRSQTIFSNTSSTAQDKENSTENKKISYWLEKLHIQKETIRTDNNKKQPVQDLQPVEEEQTVAQEAVNEQTKNTAVKREADRLAVNDLVRKSNRRIISISSSFPWSFFPDTIDIEESRVTFKFRQFLSSQSHSVDIKDISNVFIETSMFFATIQVVSRTYIQNDIKIGHLNKRKAIKVQKIIEGLRTFAMNEINTSDYEIDELVSKIEEFHTI